MNQSILKIIIVCVDSPSSMMFFLIELTENFDNVKKTFKIKDFKN